VGALQSMLSICYYTGAQTDIIFNAKKSSLFAVGKAHNTPVDSLRIGHDTVSWNDSLKYLGVYFKSGHSLLIDSEITIRKFYAAANAIYSSVKFTSRMTVLYLFETFCLPLLSYSCEALNYSSNATVNSTKCVLE